MPVAAAVVGDPAVPTILAAFDVAVERRGAAGINGGHDLELTEGEMAGMSRSKGGTVLAGDVDDLQRGAHGGQPPPGLPPAPMALPRPRRAMTLSSGLVTVRTSLGATRV
jgi:hypothetical protein